MTSAVMPKQPVKVQPTAVSATPTDWPPFFHLRSRRRFHAAKLSGCGLLMASPACARASAMLPSTDEPILLPASTALSSISPKS